MIRLYSLIWYFTRPQRPNSSSVPQWKSEISRFEFWTYLAHQKHFCEDWRATLRRILYFIFCKAPRGPTHSGMKYAKEQKQLIDGLIDKALKYEYLLISRSNSTNPTSSETFLTIDWKGREFLKPLHFFNSLLKEYGYVVTLILGIGGTFFILLLQRIYELIF